MSQPLAIHLASSALARDAWQGTLEGLRAAGISSLTCKGADLDRAIALITEHRHLSLLGVELSFDVRSESADAEVTGLLQLLGGRRAMVLLQLTGSDSHDKPSAPRAMPPAAACVTRLAKLAASWGVTLALDHRAGCWMQRVEDAVRVAMRVNRADVGVLFNFGDWHEVDGDAALLPDRLKLALPKLRAVTLPIGPLGGDGAWQVVNHANERLDTAPLMHQLSLAGRSGPLLLRENVRL